MAISNTAVLTKDAIDTMNAGIRAFSLASSEKSALAEYYGVKIRTVERWFASEGLQYRRLVGIRPAKGKRIFNMYDPDLPDGVGDGSDPDFPEQNLRLRCLLGATLGVDGGLERIPIYHGEERTLQKELPQLDDTLNWLNSVYTGTCAHGDFMQRAWVRMEIFPELSGWRGVVTFHTMDDTDESDAEETEEPE